MSFSSCINQYSKSRLPSARNGAEGSSCMEEGLLGQTATWQSLNRAWLSSAHPWPWQKRWKHSILGIFPPVSQGSRIYSKTVTKWFPCSFSKLYSWGAGERWDSREGIGREEMRKYWGEKHVDGQGYRRPRFLQVTALPLLWRVRSTHGSSRHRLRSLSPCVATQKPLFLLHSYSGTGLYLVGDHQVQKKKTLQKLAATGKSWK